MESCATSLRSRQPGDLRLLVLGLCLATFLAAWLPRLFWGLWTDEASTFWMACEGWRVAILRCAASPGQSNVYGIVESFFIWKGPWQEPLMRVPSVLAMGVAGWYLKRIAEALIHPDAGWLVIVPFFCAFDIVSLGTSARPYAMALAASLASFWYLLEWQESERKTSILKYLAASVLTLHLHYFFGFVFVIQAAYLAVSKLCGRKVRIALPMAAAIVLPASMIPVIGHLALTAKEAGTFAFPAPPTLLHLLQMCFHPRLLVAIGLGVVLVLMQTRKVKWRMVALRPESLFLLVAWMILGPVSFFVAERLTHHTFFATRFQLFAEPAFLLLVAWLVAGLQKESRHLILLAVFAGTVLHPGNLLQGWKDSDASWREPLRLVVAKSHGETPPVFVASGLVESGAVNWKDLAPATHRLFAPLTVYPIRNPTIPLPYQFGNEVKDFVQKTRIKRRCFLLAASDSELGPWMKGYMEQQGFRAEILPVNNFVVIHFMRD
jgi:hypothetical protein